MPDSTSVGEKSLALNGLGVREATVFNVNVYVAGLYLETKSSDPAQILATEQAWRLDLVFVRDVDRGDIVKAWTDGFKKNGADMAALRERIGQLNAWMTDINEGQILTFVYQPGVGLTTTVKGAVRGPIVGADFGHAMLAIWLGPKPPNGGLKKGLLGK